MIRLFALVCPERVRHCYYVNVYQKWFTPRLGPNPRYLRASYELWAFERTGNYKPVWVRHGDPTACRNVISTYRQQGFVPLRDTFRPRADGKGSFPAPAIRISKFRFQLLTLWEKIKNLTSKQPVGIVQS